MEPLQAQNMCLTYEDVMPTDCCIAQCCVAVQGGKAAAEAAINMQATGDYSAASTSQYERRWNQLYGYDFGKVYSAVHVERLHL